MAPPPPHADPRPADASEQAAEDSDGLGAAAHVLGATDLAHAITSHVAEGDLLCWALACPGFLAAARQIRPGLWSGGRITAPASYSIERLQWFVAGHVASVVEGRFGADTELQAEDLAIVEAALGREGRTQRRIGRELQLRMLFWKITAATRKAAGYVFTAVKVLAVGLAAAFAAAFAAAAVGWLFGVVEEDFAMLLALGMECCFGVYGIIWLFSRLARERTVEEAVALFLIPLVIGAALEVAFVGATTGMGHAVALTIRRVAGENAAGVAIVKFVSKESSVADQCLAAVAGRVGVVAASAARAAGMTLAMEMTVMVAVTMAMRVAVLKFAQFAVLAAEAFATPLEAADAPAGGATSRAVSAAVVGAMRAHGGSADVQERACWSLCEVASARPYPANRACAAEAGAVEALAAAMRVHGGSARVQMAACAALAAISFNCPANQARAAEAGAVEAIGSTMRAHGGDVRLQKWACAAIADIVSNCPANQVRAIEAGAVEAIVSAMRAHGGDVRLQRWGQNALNILQQHQHQD